MNNFEHMKNIFYTIFLIMFLPNIIHAQKHYKTQKHSLGFELSMSASELPGYQSNYSNTRQTIPFNSSTGYGGSVVFPYQYAPKSTFIGVQSGIGFFMWGIQRGSSYDQKESLYMVGIPIVGQFKVSKSFWIETGVQGNIPVYNTFYYSDLSNYQYSAPPGRFPFMEMQAVLGFRYHLFRSLAFKFRAHYGLTPAYYINFPEVHHPGYLYIEESNYRYRLLVAELGICYLFPIKK
jgi:hypothetical protein